MPDAPANREHPRYAHEAAATFHIGAKDVEGRTQNVSRGGLAATVDEALPVGTDIEVSLVLVFENNVHSEPLRVPARCVWSTEVDNGHQVGIMFRALTAELVGYLQIFLKYLDNQRAEKRPRDIPIDDRFH
ncbi:MAG: PilZ domain-containing protein [Deltaproteobacteria bacterium]